MQRIGRYEITGELGRGAMGVVFRAADPVIGRTVAIKTIRLADLADSHERERLQERLFREARSAGVLTHPHIVTIYDIGQEETTAYIAMEFVSGATLDQVLKSVGVLDRAKIGPVIQQTASALDYAHTRGIIHRDVKPGNIMLSEGGAAKITDFGVAKILSHQITQTDVVLGTPSYMSPEQIEAKGLDGRSDQFALAVIAYELLTGEKPFVGDSLPALLFKIVRENPIWPSRLNPSLPAAIDTVFQRAMAKNPVERFPTCHEFADALMTVLNAAPGWMPLARGSALNEPTVGAPRPGTASGSSGARSASASVAAPGPATVTATGNDAFTARVPAPPSRPMWIFPLIGVVAGVAVAAGWFFMNHGTSSPPAIVEAPPPDGAPKASVEARPEPPKPSPVAPSKPVDPPPSEPVRPQPPPVETVKTSGETTTPSRPVTSGARSAMVEITSVPPGAEASIGQTRQACTTPCEMELPAGRHVVQYKRQGYRPGVAIINVPNDTAANARLQELSGTLYVLTVPPNSQVLVDGAVKANTTPATLHLPPGKYKITLRKEGFPDYNVPVEIKDEVLSNLELNWNK